MSLASHILSGWFAFLLPSYSTFKALKHRPLSEPEIERWATYWAVVGAFVAFEYGAEWLLSWFPFYWEVKTLFLLFLSLPQTQGSTWLYKSYLEPFCTQHEAEIDAGIASAQTETLAFLQARVASLWDLVINILNKTPTAPQSSSTQNGQPAAGQSPVQALQGLWSAYAPAVFASVVAKGAPAKPATPTREPSGYNVDHRDVNDVHYQNVAEN
ncbi:hypothetical protein BV25DRAFT_1911297 [Artomyces pyxidatus]|uniref:Uncharacterized protein n=1 Tax=Artomyces pyxidatus TaxID=48021 RepID=A0ACB8TIT5_9AGAM|nr:hypothetical protein BV25DRAFT_1911297 [Artomyces pyxidatus]